ncbi:hypothetical protein M7I_2071 [Glarea lozoyensis 74030]|nr:hypothetical protein M7I_2071 [Glarea lozoyensis 74030]
MLKLAKGMMKEERDRYKEEGLYEKLVDLQNECDWQTDMEGLQEIYELFDGDLDDDNDEDNEDEAPSDTADFEEIQPPPMSPIPQRKRVFSVIELD